MLIMITMVQHPIQSIINYFGYNLCGAVWIVFLEAWNAPSNIKLGLTSMIVCFIYITSAYIYFAFPEVIYDPFHGSFGANKTVLNLKDIFLTAYNILAVFISKSIMLGFISQCKHPGLKKKKSNKKCWFGHKTVN
eukprot:496484_1